MIFFDIDGTLIDHATASAAASLALYDHFLGAIPFARGEFPETWEDIMNRHFDRFCRGEISVWEQRRRRMRDAFHDPKLTDAECDSRYRVFIQHYESQTQAFDDVVPCLKRLAGNRLGIISNGIRGQQIGKLQRAGILQYFEVMIFSEDVGLGKPDPKIFVEACRLARQNPLECIHVGDDLKADIGGGLAAGLKPVWLDRNGLRADGITVPRIPSLHHLTTALKDYLPREEAAAEHIR